MKIFTKKKLIPAALILILIIFSIFKIFRDKTPDEDILIAERSELIQKVSVTGKVQPAKDVNLAFERSGRVYAVYADVGDRISAGQLLATLNSGELLADIRRAEAQVESDKALLEQYSAAVTAEQAKLDELRNGTRPEELAIIETKVDTARIALENTINETETNLNNIYGEIIDVVNSAYSAADSALRNQVADLFTDSVFPEFSFVSTDSQAENDTRAAKIEAERLLRGFRLEINTIHTNNEAAKSSLARAETALRSVRVFLNRLSDVANTAAGVSDTTLASYKTSISAARTSINTQLTAINAQKQLIASQETASQTAVDNARLALEAAREELALKRAGATTEQIAAQEARVQQARANLASQEARIAQSQASVAGYRAQLAKNTIRSPIDGIITNQDAKVGEIVIGQTPVISVMSETKFEIKTNIPEVDIARISVGDTAHLTLDAYDEDAVFEATIIKIDPAETVIQGVSTYEVTLQFIQEDSRIKSGMTANLDILTDKRENVIAVPARAVISKNGEKIVRILENGEITEAQVKTGIRGSDGRIEILEGIKEGEAVIVSVKE